jgi:hypothetical protein
MSNTNNNVCLNCDDPSPNITNPTSLNYETSQDPVECISNYNKLFLLLVYSNYDTHFNVFSKETNNM